MVAREIYALKLIVARVATYGVALARSSLKMNFRIQIYTKYTITQKCSFKAQFYHKRHLLSIGLATAHMAGKKAARPEKN